MTTMTPRPVGAPKGSQPATFADQLRPLVDRVGGSTRAAAICGVSRQVVNLWLRAPGKAPNAATQAGAIKLLTEGKVSEK